MNSTSNQRTLVHTYVYEGAPFYYIELFITGPKSLSAFHRECEEVPIEDLTKIKTEIQQVIKTTALKRALKPFLQFN